MSSDGDKSYEADIITNPGPTQYTLLTPDEFRGLPATPWRVKNLLPCTGVAFIYGASGSGKTFLALALAAAIAEGHAWFGLKCIKAPVVYMALEGAMIRKRTLAWEDHTGRTLPNDFRLSVGEPFELLDSDDISGLAAGILGSVGPGAVIIVDTLARATAGLDENSVKEMGLAIEGAERLARQVQGLVILVHHAGKNKDAGMRGSSALFAAAEAVIEVTGKPTKGAHAWRPTKLKDAESFGERLFNLEPVNLGDDSDGDTVTSCAVVWDQTAEAVKREEFQAKGRNQRSALDVIRREIETGPAHPAPDNVPDGVRVTPYQVAVSLVSIELEGVGVGLGRGAERAKAAIAGLVKSGVLKAAGGGLSGKSKAVVWLA